MKKSIIAVLALGIILCASAEAKEQNKLVVQGGWQHTNSSTRGDGAGGTIRYERTITDWLSVGPEYSYHGPFDMYPEGGPSYGSFQAHSFMGDVVIYLPKYKKAQGYILGAWGAALYDFNESSDTKSRDIVVDGGWSFAQKYGVGLDYDLGRGWVANVEWYYYDTMIKKSAHYTDGTFSNILDTGPTLGHNETAIMFGVGKKLDTWKDLWS